MFRPAGNTMVRLFLFYFFIQIPFMLFPHFMPILPLQSVFRMLFSLFFTWLYLHVSNRHHVDRIRSTAHHLRHKSHLETAQLCIFGVGGGTSNKFLLLFANFTGFSGGCLVVWLFGRWAGVFVKRRTGVECSPNTKHEHLSFS